MPLMVPSMMPSVMTRNDISNAMFADVHTHSLAVQAQDVVAIVDTTRLSSAEQPRFGLLSVGIHPWDATQLLWYERSADIALSALQPAVVALGETGLDALRGAELDEQALILQYHSALSEQVQKPMIIHCVRAFQELITLRKQLQPRQVWIIHGFAKSKELAQRLLDAGCVLSLGAEIFREQTRLHDMIRYIPRGSFLAETDTATTYSIRDVYECICRIRGEEISVVRASIQHTLKHIFYRENER